MTDILPKGIPLYRYKNLPECVEIVLKNVKEHLIHNMAKDHLKALLQNVQDDDLIKYQDVFKKILDPLLEHKPDVHVVIDECIIEAKKNSKHSIHKYLL